MDVLEAISRLVSDITNDDIGASFVNRRCHLDENQHNENPKDDKDEDDDDDEVSLFQSAFYSDLSHRLHDLSTFLNQSKNYIAERVRASRERIGEMVERLDDRKYGNNSTNKDTENLEDLEGSEREREREREEEEKKWSLDTWRRVKIEELHLEMKVREREREVGDLKRKIREVREELGDAAENVDDNGVGDGDGDVDLNETSISESFVWRLQSALDTLVLKKSTRLDAMFSTALRIQSIWSALHVSINPSTFSEIEVAVSKWRIRHDEPHGLTCHVSCYAMIQNVLEKWLGVVKERERRMMDVIERIQTMVVEMNEDMDVPDMSDLSDDAIAKAEKLVSDITSKWTRELELKVVSLTSSLHESFQKYFIPTDYASSFFKSLENQPVPDQFHRLRCELNRLNDLYSDAIPLLSLISERRVLIDKMMAFEKSAKDPKRLFQSSFQLNEEERFRKTCFPTLLKMEDKIRLLIGDYEKRKNGKRFEVLGEVYLDKMEREIEDRYVNETVFEFVPKPVKSAPAPTQSGLNPKRTSLGTITEKSKIQERARSGTRGLKPRAVTVSPVSRSKIPPSKQKLGGLNGSNLKENARFGSNQ